MDLLPFNGNLYNINQPSNKIEFMKKILYTLTALTLPIFSFAQSTVKDTTKKVTSAVQAVESKTVLNAQAAKPQSAVEQIANGAKPAATNGSTQQPKAPASAVEAQQQMRQNPNMPLIQQTGDNTATPH
jgi:hypothetical protein